MTEMIVSKGQLMWAVLFWSQGVVQWQSCDKTVVISPCPCCTCCLKITFLVTSKKKKKKNCLQRAVTPKRHIHYLSWETRWPLIRITWLICYLQRRVLHSSCLWEMLFCPWASGKFNPVSLSHDRGLPALHRPNISQTLLHLCIGSGGLHNWFTGMWCL